MTPEEINEAAKKTPSFYPLDSKGSIPCLNTGGLQ